jgi:hypothetical protein
MKHDNPDEEGLAPRAILAMLLILVALLEFMAAGSKFLIGTLRGTLEQWPMTTGLLTLIGGCYLVLARGVWARQTWVPLFASLLTLLVIAFSLLRFVRDPEVDLTLALVFLMAMGTSLGLLAWLVQSANRDTKAPVESTDRDRPAELES